MSEESEEDAYERRYGKGWYRNTPDKDIREGRDFIDQKREEEKKAADQEKLREALFNAKPAALEDPSGLFGGGPPKFPDRTEDQPRRTDHGQGSVRQNIPSEIFPSAEVVATAAAAGSLSLNCSFLMKNATEVSGNTVTYKVLIMDGKINGNFPAGMGGGNFKLTIPNTGQTYFIIAGLTFDPTTLLENSFFFEPPRLAADVPESRVEDATHGFLYWQLGYIYFTGPPANRTMTIYQTWLGDINFAFSYGQMNGRPALLPIHSNPGWLDLEALLS